MNHFLLAAAGGALGAGARYLVNVGFARLFGTAFPWSTLFVNVVGSLAMGLLVGLLLDRDTNSDGLRIFLATGVLGGFTTFSAFSLDTANLVARGEVGAAGVYVVGSVIVSILALYAGLALAKAFAP